MDIVEPLIFMVATLLGCGAISFYTHKAANKGIVDPARVQKLHQQADVLLETLGLKPDETLPADVAKLVQEGRKIEAVERYREHTGVDLQKAKNAVEGRDDLAAVERKLDRVLRELAVTRAIKETTSKVKDAPAALDELEILVRQGKIIEAVNQYRQVHGGSMQSARQAVEAVELYLEPR